MEPLTKCDEKVSKAQSYKDAFRFVCYFYKPQLRIIAIAVTLLVISVGLEVLAPLYVGKIVDAMASGSATAEAAHIVFSCLAILIGIRIVETVFFELSEIFNDKADTLTLEKIFTELIGKVQRFDTHWHESSFAGATSRKIIRGGWSTLDLSSQIYFSFLPSILVVIATLITLIIKLPWVALVFFLFSSFYIALSSYIAIFVLRPKFEDFVKEDTALSAKVNDVIAGVQTIKSFATEASEELMIKRQAIILREKAFYAFKSASVYSIWKGLVLIALYCGMLGVAIFMWQGGKATAGDIAFIISVSAVVQSYLGNIGWFLNKIQRNLGDIKDAVDFWMKNDDIVDLPGTKDLCLYENSRERIVFSNISFHYPKTDRKLFEDMNVSIAKGEKVALVGESGSGKSTFIKLVQRLYDVDGGEILIDGQNISCVTLNSLRRHISLVPQDPMLFHRTLRDNIAYAKPDASMFEVEEAARKAHVHDFIITLKEGYDTLVGERGVKLSGGERQRVAIARAILANRPILILDEATSSLDSISEDLVKKAIEELVRDKTTVTVAHRLSTIKNCDRILVFDNGKIIEQGNHAELMQRENSSYRKLYEMQAFGAIRDREEF